MARANLNLRAGKTAAETERLLNGVARILGAQRRTQLGRPPSLAIIQVDLQGLRPLGQVTEPCPYTWLARRLTGSISAVKDVLF